MKKQATVKKSTSAAPAAKTDTIKKTTTAAPTPIEASKPKSPKKEVVKEPSIVKACETALSKLRELNIDEGLQSEMQWCLGSYQHDQNPSGLYQMAKRALAAFTVELANKTKGVTAKMIADLEKAIGSN
jgi:hypothetical protein